MKTALLVLVLAVFAAGCKTYVNIPAQAGDLASHNANSATVRDVMVVAASAAMVDRPLEGAYQVVLPQGATALTYAAVVERLGAQATYDVKGTSGELPVLEVQQVRIRAAVGEVDLARPVGPDRSEVVTVYLNWVPNGGWAVDRLRVWRTFTPSTSSGRTPDVVPVAP